MKNPLDIVKPCIRKVLPYTLRQYQHELKLNQNENPFDIPLELKDEMLAIARPRRLNRNPVTPRLPLSSTAISERKRLGHSKPWQIRRPKTIRTIHDRRFGSSFGSLSPGLTPQLALPAVNLHNPLHLLDVDWKSILVAKCCPDASITKGLIVIQYLPNTPSKLLVHDRILITETGALSPSLYSVERCKPRAPATAHWGYPRSINRLLMATDSFFLPGLPPGESPIGGSAVPLSALDG